MLIREAIDQALRMLWTQKLRSALTLFGFVWGTAAVIFLAGWGDGLYQMIEHGFSKMGKNMGMVWAGKISADFTPAADRRYLWFENADLRVAQRRAKWSLRIGGEARQYTTIAFGEKGMTIDLRGVEPETVAIRGVSLAGGRNINHIDLRLRRRVVVLGDRLRRKLLGPRGGLGSFVRIDGKPFEVVGVLSQVGLQLGRDGDAIDDQAWVPMLTFQQQWPAWWTDEPVVNRIFYQVDDRAQLSRARDELRAILSERLRVPASDPTAVKSWSPTEFLNSLKLEQVGNMMVVIAGATLLIGGMGILNMMLESVHERRREIGLRLALGAQRRDVLLQFFLESLVVSLVGGGVGLAVGIGGSLAIGSLELPDVVPIPILSWRVTIAAVVVMVLTGLVAGLVPALRASRVDPSITLRAE
ncbi:MAG: ABC transporter permease [Deltaproteobacteria bacterium]|nr:ABC transporter permease [Deltaproteobacteria bacterium]